MIEWICRAEGKEVRAKTENLLNCIEVNLQITMGKPVLNGTRIAVAVILKKLARKTSVEAIFWEYPRLTEGDIKAAALCWKDSPL